MIRFVLGLSAVLGTLGDDPSPPRALTTADFDAVTRASPYMLVAFVAPWCGHCKSLKPEFAAAAADPAVGGTASAPSPSFATVDCVAEEQLYYRYDVQGFPTIKSFRFGAEAASYDGGRETAPLVAFAKAELARDPRGYEEVATFDAWEAAVAAHGETGPVVLMIAGGGDAAGGKEGAAAAAATKKKALEQLTGAAVSPRMAKVKVLLATSAAMVSEREFTRLWEKDAATAPATVPLPSVFVYNPWELSRGTAAAAPTPGRLERLPLGAAGGAAVSAEQIIDFAHKWGWPLVVPFGQATKPLMFEKRPGFNIHLLCFAAKAGNGGGYAADFPPALTAGLRAVAAKHRGGAIFVLVDGADAEHAPMLGELGVTEPLPALRLIASDSKKGKLLKYRAAPFDGEGAAAHARAMGGGGGEGGEDSAAAAATVEATIDAFIQAVNDKSIDEQDVGARKHKKRLQAVAEAAKTGKAPKKKSAMDILDDIEGEKDDEL
jgi:thiol-disulfide isomerase/thioredoxin